MHRPLWTSLANEGLSVSLNSASTNGSPAWRTALVSARNMLAECAGCGLALSVPAARSVLRGTASLADATTMTRHFHRRVVDAVAARLRARGGVQKRFLVESLPVVFDVSGFGARYQYFAGKCYEPATTRLFLSVVRVGDVVIDIGANHGYFTVLAAHLVGTTGQIVAFEANPRVIPHLRAHIEANQIADRVTVVEAAVSDVDGGQVELFVGHGDDDLYSSLRPSEFAVQHGWLSADRTVAVPTCSVDAWLSARGQPHVRLLKIDVEGAEEFVLKGLQQTLTERPPDYIVCETTWGQSVHNSLVSSGYRAERLDAPADYGNILYVRPGIPGNDGVS